MERTRANGRTISVEGSPLPQGGWVTVYTDITRTKRQEALLRARSEELSDQLLTHAEELSATNRQLAATITALEEAKRQLTEIRGPHPPDHRNDARPYRPCRRGRALYLFQPAAELGHAGQSSRTFWACICAMPWAIRPTPPSAIISTAAFDGTPSVFEFTHEASSRRIRVAFTPDGDQGGVYILSMDVTEETQTRAALQQTRRREMAAQLTSGLAHDFSNLLTIILGMQSQTAAHGPARSGRGADQRHHWRRHAAAAALLNRIADMTGPREHTPATH